MTPTEPTRAMLQHVANARLLAAANLPYTGFGPGTDQETIRRCRAVFRHGPELEASLIFTRDAGMHACGWWKNPDYERCEHLSLAFWHAHPGSREPAPHDHQRAALWCIAFFGERRRYLWIEPPYSPAGRQNDTYHYRLFMAPDWCTPILPRKEVYSREFTEAGWKSWSDLHPPEAFGEAPP